MESEILYRKVIIKSEDDCPKEEGDYFCNRSGFNSVQHLITTLGKSYMREIRWYLLPVEQEIPSDVDIEYAAADYINEPEQTWNTADYLHIAGAYEQGAKDCRDNNIYISPK